jgi:phospho-2-dehydro-3-deoxyheptonate aldolase
MEVGADVCQQIAGGEQAIMGVMIESHLVEGSQSLESGEPLAYGKASPMPASAGKIPIPSCVSWRMR